MRQREAAITALTIGNMPLHLMSSSLLESGCQCATERLVTLAPSAPVAAASTGSRGGKRVDVCMRKLMVWSYGCARRGWHCSYAWRKTPCEAFSGRPGYKSCSSYTRGRGAGIAARAMIVSTARSRRHPHRTRAPPRRTELPRRLDSGCAATWRQRAAARMTSFFDPRPGLRIRSTSTSLETWKAALPRRANRSVPRRLVDNGRPLRRTPARGSARDCPVRPRLKDRVHVPFRCGRATPSHSEFSAIERLRRRLAPMAAAAFSEARVIPALLPRARRPSCDESALMPP
jgi:hypothetical protein